MRPMPRFLIVGLASVVLAAPSLGQRPDDQISPRSVELTREGQSLLAAGRFTEAADALETALAVDPRNRRAFVDLARVAQKQKLFGKAVRLTNRALTLEPNDLDALEVQGEAMVELGAVPRARQNLAKLQKLCGNTCRQVALLSAAITRGPSVAAATPPAQPKSN